MFYLARAHWVRSLSVLFTLFMATGMIGIRDTDAHVGLHKSLDPATWHYSPSSMTLNTTSLYCASPCFADFSAAVGNARTSWNGTSSVAWFTNSSYGPLNDVRVRVSQTGCISEWGVYACLSNGQFGRAWLLDTGGVECYSSGCIVNSLVHINSSAHSLKYSSSIGAWVDFGTPFQRQATAAHELGHVVSLDHEPANAACGDASHYQTVMDYDCMDYGIINGPVAWDVCGVNHAYYHSSYGYAGC